MSVQVIRMASGGSIMPTYRVSRHLSSKGRCRRLEFNIQQGLSMMSFGVGQEQKQEQKQEQEQPVYYCRLYRTARGILSKPCTTQLVMAFYLSTLYASPGKYPLFH
jgi:hypothetical protein